jgi:hypothetical protein
MRQFRLDTPANQPADAREFVAAFLGPFLVTFAAWVLESAKRDGVRRLYFLSRDSYLLWKVAMKLSAGHGGVDCRYLQVSRQALFLPSSEGIGAEEMPWVRRDFEVPVLRRLLAKLDLAWEPLADRFRLAGLGTSDEYVLSGESDWQRFWNTLTTEPARGALIETIQKRRAAAADYFAGQGLGDGVPWALVDLGWFLSCQESLGRLLRQVGIAASVRGYYLGLHTGRKSLRESGPAAALFYGNPPDRDSIVNSPSVLQHITPIEHVVGFAPHGTVHHYEFGAGGATAICAQVPQSIVTSSATMEALAIQFAALVHPSIPDLGDSESAACILDRLIDSFFANPDPRHARLLAGIRASKDQNNGGAQAIASPLSIPEALFPCLPWRLRKCYAWPPQEREWPEGCIALSNPVLQRILSWRKAASSIGAD